MILNIFNYKLDEARPSLQFLIFTSIHLLSAFRNFLFRMSEIICIFAR